MDAIRDLVFVQRRDELLYRVKDYRFRDWIDIKHDRDIVNGRLLHNRVGYTHRNQIPLLLGLRAEPWLGPWAGASENAESGITRITSEDVSLWKGDQRSEDSQGALSNLERQ